MAEKAERREDSRFRIELITQVTAKGADGKTFKEKTLLRNMSGGGANFITSQADRYFQGQPLNIKIDLPGTVDLMASLQGVATVSRIEQLPVSDPWQATRRFAVAVVIAVPLRFVRQDAGLSVVKPTGDLE
jgi:hypothetical protein